ncbi:MAG: hypothetical protein KAJ18_11660 [Candidatus Omnitrophica bacterium]|nr:hypothetical protein [Candidatus Omnitrophota bacterium]
MAEDGVVNVNEATSTNDDVEAAAAEAEAAAEKEPVTFGGGKFNTLEELEEGFANSQKLNGKQGQELGDARKQVDTLTKQFEKKAEPTETVDTFDNQIAEINKQVEDGDLSYTEGLAKMAVVTTERATGDAIKGVQEFQTQQQADTSKAAFLSNNPEFEQLQASGALNEIKNTLPGLHDDFSAFHAYQAGQAIVDVDTKIATAKAEGIEEGKAEMAKIATGDTNTQKVLSTPGSAIDVGKGDKPKTKQELRDSGLAAFNAAAP